MLVVDVVRWALGVGPAGTSECACMVQWKTEPADLHISCHLPETQQNTDT